MKRCPITRKLRWFSSRSSASGSGASRGEDLGRRELVQLLAHRRDLGGVGQGVGCGLGGAEHLGEHRCHVVHGEVVGAADEEAGGLVDGRPGLFGGSNE